MWLGAVIFLSVSIGIDIGNYAMFEKTGMYYLDMSAWYNSGFISVLNVAMVVFLVAMNSRKI